MSDNTVRISQELDKLLNCRNSLKSKDAIELVDLGIEAKRKELHNAIEYNEYLNGVLDPRD